MEAQSLSIVLHDDSAGYEVNPERVPLSVLRTFAKDVDDLLRGDRNDIDTSALDVALVKGSLAIVTAPTANPALVAHLLQFEKNDLLDGSDKKRQGAIVRWQKEAHGPRRIRVQIRAPFLPAPIEINADTDYRSDDADQWVRVERYLSGEIEDMGGHGRPNAHIRLPNGKTLLVDAAREMLRDEKVNRLYKQAMVRIVADYNVATREYRNAKLLEFVEHDNRLDEKELERLVQRGTKAWRDVPDANAWVDYLRGHVD